MASLEYVIAGCLRSRMLTVASVGAGRGCGGLRPRPLPRQGGGLGLGDFLPGGGRLGRRAGGRPWLHSGGSSPVYLLPLCGGDEPDGLGAVELQGAAFWLVWGAVAPV